MKNTAVACCFLLVFGSPLVAAPEGERDAGSKAREVFAAKCAQCHGSHLMQPKGRFGYVLDLKKLATNPELVIPGKPDESELWAIIKRGEMPPKGFPNVPNMEEKETVRNWIAAGAPDALEPLSPYPVAFPPPNVATAATASFTIGQAIRFVGKFHLLLLHFPIALLIAAAIGDLASAARGSTMPSPGVRFCVLLGAASAVATAALGWLYAASGVGAGTPELLLWHRWGGTAAAACAVLAALVVERDARRQTRGSMSQLLVIVGAILVGVAAHFGATIVHGGRFFTW